MPVPVLTGKSTLLTCLFRLVELRAGSVSIDGVDLARVPLATLRSRVAIIPQDPIFFTGTLRYNIDPRGEYTDEAVRAFQQRLWEHKLLCTVRETRGDDERSACGQLATQHAAKSHHRATATATQNAEAITQ